MRICPKCNQQCEIEIIPGTKRVIVLRNRKGEAERIDCLADTRPMTFCYYHNKVAAGLFAQPTKRDLTAFTEHRAA